VISRRVLLQAAYSAVGLGAWLPLRRARAGADFARCSSERFGEWETIGYRSPAVKRRVVLWLGRLQDALSSGRIGSMQALPMTRVTGAVFGDGGELILMGVEEEDGGATVPIVPDDIALALRCTILADAPPGVSIDPKIAGGEMLDYQDVVYFGGVEDTRAGQLAFSCDYWMKSVAAGLITLPVRNFCSYADRLRNSLPEVPRANGVGSRFWYYPKESAFLVSPDFTAMEFTGGGIDLLSERTFLDRSRGQTSRPGEVDTYAAAFAREMSERYDDLGLVYNDLVRLRNFSALLETFRWLADQRFPLPGWQYLLYDYRPISTNTTLKAKTIRVPYAETPNASLVLEGGVQLQIHFPKRPSIDPTGRLERTFRFIQTAALETPEFFYGY
jgi:hypothetical protein